MSSSADRIERAFAEQAGHCRRIGSEFTARLCEAIPASLDRSNAVSRRILEWDGDPAPLADNVALRVTGALHFLARSGRVAQLAAVYPPRPTPAVEQLTAAIRAAFETEWKTIDRYLDSPPQTNEVGRSAALLAGWLEIAARTGLPLSLFEIGSSAGLNLIADRYRYQFGSAGWGNPTAEPLLSPEWTGPAPALSAPLIITSRRGCDRSPVDLRDERECERLMSYVWPDQPARLARLSAAIAAMRSDPPELDRSDAAEWVRGQLVDTLPAGTTRVLFHSIVWQYLPARTQEAITAHMSKLASAARADAPIAWLRFELSGERSDVELRLALWPGGEERLLAVSHAHGNWIRWNG